MEILDFLFQTDKNSQFRLKKKAEKAEQKTNHLIKKIKETGIKLVQAKEAEQNATKLHIDAVKNAENKMQIANKAQNSVLAVLEELNNNDILVYVNRNLTTTTIATTIIASLCGFALFKLRYMKI